MDDNNLFYSCFAESQHIFEFVGRKFFHCYESPKTQYTGHRSLHVLPVSSINKVYTVYKSLEDTH